MAMKPFCGYNFADYFAHWLSFDKSGAKLPRIFHVNWFRKDADGRFMWPGFGDNLRVLDWMIQRVEGRAEGRETPIGTLPAKGEINSEDLSLAPGALEELLRVDVNGWQEELRAIGLYLDGFGARMPERLKAERERVSKALDAAVTESRAANVA
jgi:phosphoenolpyruvate carboxykinase (GTP)